MVEKLAQMQNNPLTKFSWQPNEPKEDVKTNTSTKTKTPSFDGKQSWSTYHKHFEDAAWTEAEKATAPIFSQQSYTKLVRHFDMGYDDQHLQQGYQAQLMNKIEEHGRPCSSSK